MPNGVGGTYTQNGSNLTITLGPMTLVACTDDATTAQERAIVGGLPRVVLFTQTGQLALLDDKGAAVLIYDANTAGLEGTSWTATGVNTGNGGVQTTALTATISAAFAPAGAAQRIRRMQPVQRHVRDVGQRRADDLECGDDAESVRRRRNDARVAVHRRPRQGHDLLDLGCEAHPPGRGGATQATFTAAP